VVADVGLKSPLVCHVVVLPNDSEVTFDKATVRPSAAVYVNPVMLAVDAVPLA